MKVPGSWPLPSYPHLRRLELAQTGLTPIGLRYLIEAYADQLESLQLYGNPLEDSGAELVAAAMWPRMIPRTGNSFEVGLFLGECGIGARGTKALRESKTIPSNIPTLFLGGS
jgi:hypothetical protein